ncbi:hypothetical protein [Aminobacter phage Erebus]|nr:hypothetical protein [Aminobacter phage Erebus]
MVNMVSKTCSPRRATTLEQRMHLPGFVGCAPQSARPMKVAPVSVLVGLIISGMEQIPSFIIGDLMRCRRRMQPHLAKSGRKRLVRANWFRLLLLPTPLHRQIPSS